PRCGGFIRIGVQSAKEAATGVVAGGSEVRDRDIPKYFRSDSAFALRKLLRQRLWKVGAVVRVSARWVWLQVAAAWPYRELWQRVWAAVQGVVRPAAVGVVGASGP